MNPYCGSKMLSGYLRAKGILIPRERIRKSLNRVDAVGIAARQCKAIRRRLYDVTRPLGLWYFDANHKLIKWRFVIHEAIDGYTRIPVFFRCSTNNRAHTVYSYFIDAVERYGLPSRTRCDQGSENVDVVQYICLLCVVRGEVLLWLVKAFPTSG